MKITTEQWNDFDKRLCCCLFVVFTFLLLFITHVSAIPTATGVYDIGNNNATIIVLNSYGPTWVTWGRESGHQLWVTANQTAYGPVNITVWGAPLMGSKTYFARACNQSGCSGEVSFTTSANTQITDQNLREGFLNMTASHFNPVYVAGTLAQGYTRIMPATVVFGILFGVITIGFWLRTKSVRLVSILMLIASPFIMTSNAGLYLGVPLVEQAIGQALLAAAIAGIGLSFIKK